jgi:hypothetical protein
LTTNSQNINLPLHSEWMGRGIGELQHRCGLEAERQVAGLGRLLGHQAGQEDR